MRWEIERYVRVYRRDTPKWSLVPWRTKAFFWELLRQADLDGRIECSDLSPAQAVVALFRGVPDDILEVERHLAILLADGCLRDVAADAKHGRHIHVRNYRDAQGVPMSGADRTKKWREEHQAKRGSSGGGDGGDGGTSQRHKRRANKACDESDARDAHPSEPSHPSHPSEPSPDHDRHRGTAARARANGTERREASRAERYPLAVQLHAALVDRYPNIAGPPTDQAALALHARCQLRGVEDFARDCVAFADEKRVEPRSLAYFATCIGDIPEADEPRAAGEFPKPGDPDFNDIAAWHGDQAAFDARTDGKTWEQATGLKRPKYVPPKTPEEEAAERAAREKLS